MKDKNSYISNLQKRCADLQAKNEELEDNVLMMSAKVAEMEGATGARRGVEGVLELLGVLGSILTLSFRPAIISSTSAESKISLSKRASAMVFKNLRFFLRISVARLWQDSTIRFTSASINWAVCSE